MVELSGTLAGRWLAGYLNSYLQKLISDDPDSPNSQMMRSVVKNMPLRGIGMMSGGLVPRGVLEGVLTMVNGRFLKGLIAALRASRRKD
jgi:hypothetical protein